ncbi:MAG: 3-isopropylmalate dehydratase small subunit [Dehalococcoidia bacterium]|nr:3-isopropylmalate dehydratase small subunit [Dehalococcoidia bacterium]MDD5494057.1 3-isopropylmalate dehydratase small subunit [Dehalococcoidia bacterium]
MSLKGKVHKYGTNIDTDAIIPARYLNMHEAAELAEHCMEDIDEEFVKRVQAGDIVVADTNFGCGSSREHAPLALKGSGISCVIAKSFARIFFRNAINTGLPLLECEEAADNIEAGDAVEVDLAGGRIINHSSGKTFTAKPYPEFMMQIIAEGGLVEHTKKKASGAR